MLSLWVPPSTLWAPPMLCMPQPHIPPTPRPAACVYPAGQRASKHVQKTGQTLQDWKKTNQLEHLDPCQDIL